MKFDNLDWDIILVGLNSGENPIIVPNATDVYKWKAVVEGQEEVKHILIMCLNGKQITKEDLKEKVGYYYGGNLLKLLDENDNSL